MIRRITQKRYKEAMRRRKLGFGEPGLFFLAEDKKYYHCDQVSMKGAAEIREFNKKIKDQKKQQIGLFAGE